MITRLVTVAFGTPGRSVAKDNTLKSFAQI